MRTAQLMRIIVEHLLDNDDKFENIFDEALADALKCLKYSSNRSKLN